MGTELGFRVVVFVLGTLPVALTLVAVLMH
jgi:hypothetical protein